MCSQCSAFPVGHEPCCGQFSSPGKLSQHRCAGRGCICLLSLRCTLLGEMLKPSHVSLQLRNCLLTSVTLRDLAG